MELASSTLTAALVGVIVILTKVIEWFMNRNSNGKKQAKDYNGHGGEALTRIETKLDMLSSGLTEMRQDRVQFLAHFAVADSSHERIIERLGDVVAGVERVANNIDDLKK